MMCQICQMTSWHLWWNGATSTGITRCHCVLHSCDLFWPLAVSGSVLASCVYTPCCYMDQSCCTGLQVQGAFDWEILLCRRAPTACAAECRGSSGRCSSGQGGSGTPSEVPLPGMQR